MRNGYRYNLKRNVPSKGYKVWRCVHRKICNAVLRNNSTNVISENLHICQPSSIENKIKSKVLECIRRAENEKTPLATIYTEAFQEYATASPDVIAKIPKLHSMQDKIYKHRKKKRNENRN